MNTLSLCLKTVVVLFTLTVVGVYGKKWQTREWCFKTTKTFTRTVNVHVPTQRCRNVLVRGPFVENGDSNQPVNFKSPPRVPLKDNKQTAEEVMRLYPGLFLNKTTAEEVNKKLKKEGLKPIGPKPEIRPGGIRPSINKQGKNIGGNHDGDLHCPTYRNLIKAPDSMLNIQREPRDIVHFSSEDVFQYVHKGACGGASTQSCSGGSCLQEKSIVYLMVWKDDPSWPTGFEPFEVDAYCSCKNISP